ncbi:hypothetical protein WJX73_007137 [Symbiochloris irregularis]|uniref:Uncharacterized protein n=1 Tax=Symbiochloris irregularis TaxID=706552 RepID=A0AAW1NNT8_9CHLO
MALFVLQPKSWATVSSYDVLQDGALTYTVDASGCWGLSLALIDRQTDRGLLLGAKRGALSSKADITGPAGEFVTTAKISNWKLCEISFLYGGREYRWAQKMKWTSCKTSAGGRTAVLPMLN